MKAISAALAFAMLVGSNELARGQILMRASLASSGAEGNGNSGGGPISSDGRFLAFGSYASNLVPSDINVLPDIFVHDTATGTTIRVNVDPFGGDANDESYDPAISADGRFVAFFSYASNLVAGDSRNRDVFVRDVVAGVTEIVSVDSSGVRGDSDSFPAAISADGRFVAFSSFASNLVTGDTNGIPDIFVHDRQTGATERVSIDSSGGQAQGGSGYGYPSAISSDGQVIAFLSDATNLVPGDTNGVTDVFVHDRGSGLTERVNVDSAGIQADDASNDLALSGDGRVVAFHSWASNLVSGDTNQSSDVFVHDRQTGLTDRVSVDSSGAEASGFSYFPFISDDGNLVGFSSDASDLVSNDTNNATDAFVHDRTTGVTERISVDSTGAQGNGGSAGAAISDDGQTVVFSSYASNFVPNDGNDSYDVFVRLPCSTIASWSNYGAGFPGTFGVPTLTSRSNPVLGSDVTIDVGSSSGLYSVALLFVGYQQTSIPSGWGGDLLVVPAVTELLGLPPTGAVVTGVVPMLTPLCGFEVDLQAIELDPGAAKGVSFTQGLQLVLGR